MLPFFKKITGIFSITIMVIGAPVNCKSKYDPTTLVFPPYLHTYGIRKATKYHLFLFMQNKVKFSDPQALAVVRLDSWDDPGQTDDDDEVTVYGVNSGQNNIIYNTSMTTLGVYGLSEKGEQKLNKPYGITANERGDVYLADTGNNRIVRMVNDGKHLRFIRAIGRAGTGEKNLNQPRGVSLDSQGNIYITDTGNHSIKVYDRNDNFVYCFGTFGKENGKLHYPDAIAAVDRRLQWSFYKDEFIVVVDMNNTRIQKFALNGQFLKSIQASDFGFAISFLAYIALDYYNNLYVTDKLNHCIHKFDRNLNYLGSYGRKGTGDKEFVEPRGITIYRRFGQVFVAEKEGAQYYWVGTDYADFSVQVQQEKNIIMFKYFLTEPSFITADVFNDNDEFITRIWNNRFKTSGQQNDIWDGKLRSWPDSILIKDKLVVPAQYKLTKQLPAGNYKIRYKFEPTYSSYRYFSREKIEQFILR